MMRLFTSVASLAPFAAARLAPSHSTIRTLAGIRGGNQEFETLSEPAPGSPFHYAFPVHDLEAAKDFYGSVLGCQEGRSSEKWQDYSLHGMFDISCFIAERTSPATSLTRKTTRLTALSLFFLNSGHQIVCHWVGNDYRCQDYFNPVDGDEVPVPHAGLALTVDQFHELADRLKKNGMEFIIEPHLRFQGQPGEQYTMFFKDPSGNNLEFKAMTKVENLFAKYNVVDDEETK